MKQEIDNSREKAIIINVLLNLLALIPAVITAVLMFLSVSPDLDRILMIGYPIIAALLMAVVNLKYCLKNFVVCFVHWWFIMCIIAGICFLAQYGIYELMPVKVEKGEILLVVEFWFCVAVITVCSVVCQIILPIARSRKNRKEKSETENKTA